MSDFSNRLDQLVQPLDAEKHAFEIARLKKCRSATDLDRVAKDGGGWLTPGTKDPRLKLVKHGTGTFIVVNYVDGWSSRLSMVDFPGWR